jgi:4'-phosphopantetheinyl transferase
MEPLRPEPGETCVLHVNLDPEPECGEFEQLIEWNVLSAEERTRARRFVMPRHGRRFTVCRGALRLILGRLTNAPPQDIAFRFGPGGKPELVGPGPPGGVHLPRFNVTHTEDRALIAISHDREVGVDLERLRTISEAARIVESYFTPAEQAQFTSLPESIRASAFLRGWTRKEAILKGKGLGLAGLAASYETMFGTMELSEQFELASPLPRIDEWWLWEAMPRAGYFAALAVREFSR